MIVVLKQNADKAHIDSLISWLQGKNLQINYSKGESRTILGLIGDTTQLDADMIRALDIVDAVRRIGEPYKKANRKFHPEDTIVKVGNVEIGGGNLTLMAGPSAIENEDQIMAVANATKEAGATILHGGAFTARTSPYEFKGLQEDGITLQKKAGKAYDMPIASEIMDISQLEAFQDVDLFIVGARNMQNYELLKELGKTKKPILLKRAVSATYEELLMSAEYILSEGNPNVILCERGTRSFEPFTKNTLDLSIIPALKLKTHLPVVVDPSRGCGKSELVPALAYAAVAAGADGVMIEVHNNPTAALSNGTQQLKTEEFATVAKKCFAIHKTLNEEV